MPTDVRQIVALFLFFGGIALSMWRLPRGDRWHVVLCGLAVVMWCGVLIVEPRTRTFGYALIVSNFLAIALSRPFQRRIASRR